LACSDGSFYCGATTNLDRRLAAHRNGKGARYTRSRLPVRLLAWWHPPSYDEARSHEARFKALSRAEKERFIASGDAFGLPLCLPELAEEAGENRC
jgi:putative endonuclease